MNERCWHKVHAWIGRVIGIYILVFVASGMAIVFREEIEAPSLSASCAGEIAAAEIAVAQAMPGYIAPWTLVLGRNMQPHQALLSVSPDGHSGAEPTSIWIHPCTGEILAERRWISVSMAWMYGFHTSLFMGTGGRLLAGTGGIVLVLMLVTGTALAVRKPPGGKPGVVRRWHWRVGLATVPGMIVMLVTGLWLAVYDWTYPLIQRASPTVTISRPAESVSLPLSLDAAVALAMRHVPGEARMVDFLGNADRTVVISLRTGSDASPHRPATRVWVDRNAGTVIATRTAKSMGSLEHMESWLVPLHGGQAFGPIGRWAAFLTGVLLLVSASLGVGSLVSKKLAARIGS